MFEMTIRGKLTLETVVNFIHTFNALLTFTTAAKALLHNSWNFRQLSVNNSQTAKTSNWLFNDDRLKFVNTLQTRSHHQAIIRVMTE